MKRCLVLCGAVLLAVAGCQTRSISDSGYRSGYDRGGSRQYKGELSELDILGIAPEQDATAANIAHALESAATPKVKRGDRIILIQSGATVPDNAMMQEAMIHFSVAPFSGIPPAPEVRLAESLRLRAAQGGYRHIFCYWGVLESAQLDREGKVVSWVPIVGYYVPDQKQQMRIRLRGLLLDVATGHWKMFTPEPHDSTGISSGWTRETIDQQLVEKLKELAYKRLIRDLLAD